MNIDIKFTIEPDENADDYTELYTADVVLPDGSGFTVRASDIDVTYDQFRADIFEDLLASIAEAAGVEVTVEEEDYAAVDIDDISDYIADCDEDRCGC